MDADEELLYREMNEEDPYYMGDRDDDTDGENPSRESTCDAPLQSAGSGETTDRDAIRGCMGCLLLILAAILLLIFIL